MVFAERVPTLDRHPGSRPASPRPRLAETAGLVRPLVLAGERRLVVTGALGELLPGGGLQRGTVVSIEGAPGSGVTSLLLQLLAAATAAGEWAAAVDPEGVFGGLAAAEAGVALDRLAVVRQVSPECWGRAVAILLDGVSLVTATVPAPVRAPEARRLAARARERSAVLVASGRWPGEVALRLRAEGSGWRGLGWGEGLLGERASGPVAVRVAS